ncbi:hypothetical protein K402DRAFT_338380 [Aulographum hederae CBS 113979]|uniref:Alpha-galactosidase A n=1 Tax=Aulographum hederae CBS 113979 TaxID=1176131 RepID=A0A6G1GR71_9PEZI|nr:hypothetical protein K402DRAFT_338380 [Aulographum hederae CBS 113979]
MSARPTVSILPPSEDAHNNCGELRLLIHEKQVKYLFVDSTFCEAKNVRFGEDVLRLLPPMPPGDWNWGSVTYNRLTKKSNLAVRKKFFPRVHHVWHYLSINHLEFEIVEMIKSNVWVVTAPRFPEPVILKITKNNDQGITAIDKETEAYSWIEGSGVGPKFLGHVHEEGRVIGFVIEKVEGIHPYMNQHSEQTRAAMGKLHALGVRHCDLNACNVLVREDKAVIIDFETANKTNDQKLLEKEAADWVEKMTPK